MSTLRVSYDFAGVAVAHFALKRAVTSRRVVCCDISESSPLCCRIVEHTVKPKRIHRCVSRKLRKDTRTSQVHVLVTTPPCQDFSSNGLRRGARQPRGKLGRCSVKWVLQQPLEMRPWVVLFENVKPLLTQFVHRREIKKWTSKLQKAGYSVQWSLMNSAEHGCCQRRIRTIGVAILKNREQKPFRFPQPVARKFTFAELVKPVTAGDKPLTLPHGSAGALAKVKTLVKPALKKHFGPEVSLREAKQHLRSQLAQGVHRPFALDVDCSIGFDCSTGGDNLDALL